MERCTRGDVRSCDTSDPSGLDVKCPHFPPSLGRVLDKVELLP
jgi:hypothetical protein